MECAIHCCMWLSLVPVVWMIAGKRFEWTTCYLFEWGWYNPTTCKFSKWPCRMASKLFTASGCKRFCQILTDVFTHKLQSVKPLLVHDWGLYGSHPGLASIGIPFWNSHLKQHLGVASCKVHLQLLVSITAKMSILLEIMIPKVFDIEKPIPISTSVVLQWLQLHCFRHRLVIRLPSPSARCELDGTCTCATNYTGLACENHCPSGCSGKGACTGGAKIKWKGAEQKPGIRCILSCWWVVIVYVGCCSFI